MSTKNRWLVKAYVGTVRDFRKEFIGLEERESGNQGNCGSGPGADDRD